MELQYAGRSRRWIRQRGLFSFPTTTTRLCVKAHRHAGACGYVLKDNLLEVTGWLREFSTRTEGSEQVRPFGTGRRRSLDQTAVIAEEIKT